MKTKLVAQNNFSLRKCKSLNPDWLLKQPVGWALCQYALKLLLKGQVPPGDGVVDYIDKQYLGCQAKQQASHQSSKNTMAKKCTTSSDSISDVWQSSSFLKEVSCQMLFEGKDEHLFKKCH